MKRNALLVMALALLCGCTTTGGRYQVGVSNAGDTPVTDVVIKSEGIILHQSASLGAHSKAEYRAMENSIPAVSTVRWRTAEGALIEREVRAGKPISEDFRGTVLFEIQTNGRVKLFILDGTDNGSSHMPWAKPETWEGSPTIPGLSGQ